VDEKVLSEIYFINYGKVIQKSLQKSGYSINDIDFLFINQVKKAYQKRF